MHSENVCNLIWLRNTFEQSSGFVQELFFVYFTLSDNQRYGGSLPCFRQTFEGTKMSV